MGALDLQAARGLDQREVVTHWKRKSYGREDTLNEDELNVGKLKNKIEILAGKVASSLDKAQTSCRTITLKIKYSNFESITRASSLSLETRDHQVIAKICCDLLLSKTEAGRRPIRLVGVSVSKLVDD